MRPVTLHIADDVDVNEFSVPIAYAIQYAQNYRRSDASVDTVSVSITRDYLTSHGEACALTFHYPALKLWGDLAVPSLIMGALQRAPGAPWEYHTSPSDPWYA